MRTQFFMHSTFLSSHGRQEELALRLLFIRILITIKENAALVTLSLPRWHYLMVLPPRRLPTDRIQVHLDQLGYRGIDRVYTRVPFSTKKPEKSADTPQHALPESLATGSKGTGISLSQKWQIQQLWLLQETQICPGLISLCLYHHTRNKSHYALSGSQELTSSGTGKMIPCLQSDQTAHRNEILTCLEEALSSQAWDPVCPCHSKLS